MTGSNVEKRDASLTIGAVLWRPDGTDGVKALVEVERTDEDEIAIQIEPVDGESLTGLYLSKAAAYELVGLLEQARKEGACG